MSTTTDPGAERRADSDTDAHAQCIEALPAYLGGSLAADAAVRLVAHVEACSDCAAELKLAHRVREHVGREWRELAPLLEPEHESAQFDRLWSRIAQTQPAPQVPRKPAPRRWTSSIAAIAATLLLGAGGVWFRSAEMATYTTLADPPRHACGSVRVQVAGATASTRDALEATGARVVDGPTADGVYTLTATDPAAAIAALRALPQVRLAEPTDC